MATLARRHERTEPLWPLLTSTVSSRERIRLVYELESSPAHRSCLVTLNFFSRCLQNDLRSQDAFGWRRLQVGGELMWLPFGQLTATCESITNMPTRSLRLWEFSCVYARPSPKVSFQTASAQNTGRRGKMSPRTTRMMNVGGAYRGSLMHVMPSE